MYIFFLYTTLVNVFTLSFQALYKFYWTRSTFELLWPKFLLEINKVSTWLVYISVYRPVCFVAFETFLQLQISYLKSSQVQCISTFEKTTKFVESSFKQ